MRALLRGIPDSFPRALAALAAAFPDHRVQAVELPPGVLHLKCVCSPLGDGRVLLAERTVELPGIDVVPVPWEERDAANVVSVGRHAVAPAEFPRALEVLSRAGFTVHPVATTEVRKADGALTCQSIVIGGDGPPRS